MKTCLLWFVVFFVSTNSIAQDSIPVKWMLFTTIGLQQHDKRLFGFRLQSLLQNQNEFLGTYQFSTGVERKIIGNNKVDIYSGLGFAMELSTFLRPFNHQHGGRYGDESIKLTNRYYKYLVQFPFKSRWKLNSKWNISLDAIPQMDFLTVADHTKAKSSSIKYSWFDFNLYSIELNSGIILLTNFAEFGLQLRVFQIKKIDRILFNDILFDPRINQTTELYNPIKINLTMALRIGGSK